MWHQYNHMEYMKDTLPSLFIPHGGGPCFFMDDPYGEWNGMADYLRGIPAMVPAEPTAILIISAHWETDGFTFTGTQQPSLIYDYSGFPPHTYQLTYPVPGDPELAGRAASLLANAGLRTSVDPNRGHDHGVFIPLKVAFPDATIPVVEMSLDASLDPALHIAAGQALAPLRDEGVLIIGSGYSFHNMRAFDNPKSTPLSADFDTALSKAVCAPMEERINQLTQWKAMPFALFAHPRAEHLLPLMVAAGAGGKGHKNYGEVVSKTAISGYVFD
jgi:aromatic ring-opening dioxygenase catalytic subunit (LigB family)